MRMRAIHTAPRRLQATPWLVILAIALIAAGDSHASEAQEGLPVEVSEVTVKPAVSPTPGARVVLNVEDLVAAGVRYRWVQSEGPPVAIEDATRRSIEVTIPGGAPRLGFLLVATGRDRVRIVRVTIPIQTTVPGVLAVAGGGRIERRSRHRDVRGSRRRRRRSARRDRASRHSERVGQPSRARTGLPLGPAQRTADRRGATRACVLFVRSQRRRSLSVRIAGCCGRCHFRARRGYGPGRRCVVRFGTQDRSAPRSQAEWTTAPRPRRGCRRVSRSGAGAGNGAATPGRRETGRRAGGRRVRVGRRSGRSLYVLRRAARRGETPPGRGDSGGAPPAAGVGPERLPTTHLDDHQPACGFGRGLAVAAESRKTPHAGAAARCAKSFHDAGAHVPRALGHRAVRTLVAATWEKMKG